MNCLIDIINIALSKIDKKNILDYSNVHLIKDIDEWKKILKEWCRDNSKCEYRFFENNELFILDYEIVKNIERYKNMPKKHYNNSIVVPTLREILKKYNENIQAENDTQWFYDELAISLVYDNNSEKNIINSNLVIEDLYRMCYISSKTLYKKICDYIAHNYDGNLIKKYLKNTNILINDMDRIILEIKNDMKNEYNNWPINIESKNVIIYSKEILNYVNKINKYIEDNFNNSDKYFEINDKKIEIFIMNKKDFLEFQNALNRTVYDWVCGTTSNCICAVVTYEEYIAYEKRKKCTFEDYLDMIMHEIIHARHQLNGNTKKIKEANWFKEALACNLGNPRGKKEIKLDCNVEDLINSNNINYDVYYTIGKYILDNYSIDKVKEYINDDNKVVFDSIKIFSEVKKIYEEI